MPVYSYRKNNGELIELQMSIDEKSFREQNGVIELEDGETAMRDILSDHKGVKHCPGNWPMHSYAMGVGVDQVDEAQDHSRMIGIPTEFDRQTGDAIFTSAAHRKRYCEASGFVDKNAGFCDPQTDRSLDYHE